MPSLFTKQELKAKSGMELRGILNSFGETTNGNKVTLVHRIMEHQKQDQPDVKQEVTSETPVASDAGSESEDDEFQIHKSQPPEEDTKLSKTQMRVIKLISRPHDARSNPEIDMLLPWLKNKSDVMKNLEDYILKDIVRGCDHLKVGGDEIVIRQGDTGDCFYILLRGRVSVFISEKKEDSEDVDPPAQKSADKKLRWRSLTATVVEDIKTNRSRKVNRKDFGKYIVAFEPGKAFGEIALLSDDRVRTASIISDEDCDLMVINRSVYNATLKAYYERDYEERRDFIENNILFQDWNKKYKKQLERGLMKECYAMDMPIIKQGQPLSGLIFITRGNAKVLVEPDRHNRQYPQMRPFQTENDIYELEDMKPKKRKKYSHSSTGKRDRREDDAKSAVSRRSAPDDALRYNDKRREGITNEQVRVKRKEGYAAAEQRALNRSIVLCVVRDGAVFGDIELVQNLKTFSHTVVTTTYTEVFSLSIKNIERLVGRRNPETMAMLEEIVLDKMCRRATYVQGCNIPLVNHLVFKMTGEQKPAPRQMAPSLKSCSKHLPDRYSLFQHVVDEYLRDRAPLLDTAVPGSAYYKAVMRERASHRNRLRQRKTDVKRAAMEREIRANIMSRRTVRTQYRPPSESEDEGQEEKTEKQPAHTIKKDKLALPAIHTTVHSPEPMEIKPTTPTPAPMVSFLTENSDKYGETPPRSRQSMSRSTNKREKGSIDMRADAPGHQSFLTVCMVYDEESHKSKITHAGSLLDLTKDIFHERYESRPVSQAPSDSKMVGAPPDMTSRENSCGSRKSSANARSGVEIIVLPVSAKSRGLPPLNEDQNSTIAGLSPRDNVTSKPPLPSFNPRSSNTKRSQGNDGVLSLPAVGKKQNDDTNGRSKKGAQLLFTQKAQQRQQQQQQHQQQEEQQQEDEDALDHPTSEMKTLSTLGTKGGAPKNEKYSVKSLQMQVDANLALPNIQTTPKITPRKTTKKVSKKR